MHSLVASALLMMVTPQGAPSIHRMSISVRGPLALVEVERTLVAEAATRELVWDVALPDGAARNRQQHSTKECPGWPFNP